MTPSIQCSTGPFWAFRLEDAMDALAEAGFREIELMVTRDPSTQEPDVPLALAQERGLRIASVHGPFLVVTKAVWGMDPVAKIRRGVEMCSALGADTMVVHPPLLWEAAYADWVRHELGQLSADTGVTVAVETMYPKWFRGRRLSVYRWLEPATLYEAAPAVAMDTSHLTVARHDVFDAYRTLAPKLAHVHLSNNAGDGRDGHLELERGALDIERFLQKLAATSYQGAVSLELAVNAYIERPQELTQMLGRNRELIERKLSERSVDEAARRA